MGKSFKKGCLKDKFLPSKNEDKILQKIKEHLDRARQYHIDIADEHRGLHLHEEVE